MKLLFLRHGLTQGNLEKRYIGTTDEPLCTEGIEALKQLSVPPCERLFISPLLRCRQTAELLFPGKVQEVADDFRECDFGRFEGKHYRELAADAAYQAWVDSGGTLPFPDGEHPAAFRERCVAAFAACMASVTADSTAAFIVHGGTIMAILSHYAGGGYYDYQIPCGHGFLTEWENNALRILEVL